MVFTFVTTLRRTVVMVAALGVLALGAYLYSLTPLASPLLAAHGAPPPALTVPTAVLTTTDFVVTAGSVSPPALPMPPPPVNLTLGLALIAWNAGVILSLTASVAVVQTVLKRRKRGHKLIAIPK